MSSLPPFLLRLFIVVVLTLRTMYLLSRGEGIIIIIYILFCTYSFLLLIEKKTKKKEEKKIRFPLSRKPEKAALAKMGARIG